MSSDRLSRKYGIPDGAGSGSLLREGTLERVPSRPPHAFERERLEALRELELFVRPDDPPMKSLARQAAGVCHSPIGLVSLMDEDAQRVIGSFGLEIDRVDRCDTICATTILQPSVLVVEDTRHDPRFRNLPGVLGEPYVRFYAGAPIFDASGLPLGTVCAVDVKPHDVSSRALHALQRFATLAATVLQTRLHFAQCRNTPLREGADAYLDTLLATFVEPRANVESI